MALEILDNIGQVTAGHLLDAVLFSRMILTQNDWILILARL